MHSEPTRIMLILLSVIFNQMAAWQDDPAIMQQCNAIPLNDVFWCFQGDLTKKAELVVSKCVSQIKCTSVLKRSGWPKKMLIISSISRGKVPQLVWELDAKKSLPASLTASISLICAATVGSRHQHKYTFLYRAFFQLAIKLCGTKEVLCQISEFFIQPD